MRSLHIQRSYLLCTSHFFGSRKDSSSDHCLGLFISNISYIHKKSSLLCDRTMIITGCKISVLYTEQMESIQIKESHSQKRIWPNSVLLIVLIVILFLFFVGCKNNQRKYRNLANDTILFVTLISCQIYAVYFIILYKILTTKTTIYIFPNGEKLSTSINS
jgi:hypothetical protein